MSTQIKESEFKAKIEAFSKLHQEGIEAWKKAGKILVELLEEDTRAYDRIIEMCPSVTPGMLAIFERIGRGLLYPPLAVAGSIGEKYLQNLPYSQQVKYESDPIPLVVETPDGTDILMVKAKDMTKEQVLQVFKRDRIRSEGEQKAWRIQRASNAAKPPTQSPWSIRAGKIIISAPAEFSLKEWMAIGAQLS